MPETETITMVKPMPDSFLRLPLIMKPEPRHILPIHPTAEFYHGTRAPYFQQFQPGSSLTPQPDLAFWYAQLGGAVRKTRQSGPARLMNVRVNLPDGAPLIRGTEAFHEHHTMLTMTRATSPTEQEKRRHQEDDLRLRYHQQAAAATQETGCSAYYSHLHGSDLEAELVVLDPSCVTIRDQDMPVEDPYRLGGMSKESKRTFLAQVDDLIKRISEAENE